MTDAEWLASDAIRMLDYLDQQNASPRKLRLFSCARCRLLWHLLADNRSRTAVEIGERFADGHATVEELQTAAAEAWAAAETGPQANTPSAWVAAGTVSEGDPVGGGFWDVAWDFCSGASHSETSALDTAGEHEAMPLRDIFGNPFRPVAVDSRWRSETVVALANAIYTDQAFDRMPILADALEEAGCDHADILAHCRGDGPHVRGCWVVDLVLGKS